MKRVPRSLVLFVAVLIVGILPITGCFGGCNPISCLLAGKVKDLGVKYTAADLQSALTKIGMQVQELPAAAAVKDSLKYSGQKALNTIFNNSELTAMLNNNVWKYNPMKSVQLKVGNNGSSEFAAEIMTDRLAGFAEYMGGSSSDVKQITDMISMVGGSPAIYIKSTASVVAGKISGSLQEAQIGPVTLDAAQLKDLGPQLISLVQGNMGRVPGFSIKTLTFNNARTVFDGTVPAIKYVAKVK